MDESDWQYKLLYTLFIFYDLIYLAMLALSLMNFTQYVIPMKMQYPQIWGFYVCAIVMYICCLCEISYYIFSDDVDGYAKDHDLVLDDDYEF